MRLLLHIALVASSMRAIAQTPVELTELLAEDRARGTAQLFFENQILRQASLNWDGQHVRFLLAGLPPIIMDPDKASVQTKKHPYADEYVTMFTWDTPDYPHILQLLYRPEAARKADNVKYYADSKHDLPSLIFSYHNRVIGGLIEVQAGLFTHGQDDRELRTLIDDFKANGGQFVSFKASDDELCALDLERLRIRTRR